MPRWFYWGFFSLCWGIIKQELMLAVNQFFSMNQQGLHLLNQAFIILIPKKPKPQRVSDFRPISLTHSFANIVTKILAKRLSPELHQLVSNNQTDFIKSRCIQDSFMYVQGVIRDLHKKKNHALFIKLNISKAFDTINWPYLLGVMSHLGFGQTWRNWISSLWCTTTSTVLLNGEPGKRLLHCRGIRQGDPLSPMLFLLAMEPLNLLFQKAQQNHLLQKLSPACDAFRVSMYANDVVVFVHSNEQELQITDCILQIFARASGLMTNMSKTQYYPIQCDHVNLQFLGVAERAISSFPCIYLGLPLSIKKPTKISNTTLCSENSQ
jgi:hypothetical protein